MDSPQSRSSVWFFAALVALTLIAIATLTIYNLRQQLKPETVDRAIALWKENGRTDYVLAYTVKHDDNVDVDHFVVKVKNGAAYEVLFNATPMDERFLADKGMHGLLSDVAKFMKCDSEPGKPKVYVRGDFHAQTGALIRYVRRVMGTRQRVEIVVESLQPHEDQSKTGPDPSKK